MNSISYSFLTKSLKCCIYWFNIFIRIIFGRSRLEKDFDTVNKLRLSTIYSESMVGFTDYSNLSPFSYKNKAVKRLIWELKYKNQREVVLFWAKILTEEMIANMVDCIPCSSRDSKNFNASSIYILPMPMSLEKGKDRGWNQTEELLKSCEIILENFYNNFISCVHIDYDLVERSDRTNQHKLKTKNERMKNLNNIFKIKNGAGKLLGKRFLIIDDVTTTGASLSELKKVLKENGAISTTSITLAR